MKWHNYHLIFWHIFFWGFLSLGSNFLQFEKENFDNLERKIFNSLEKENFGMSVTSPFKNNLGLKLINFATQFTNSLFIHFISFQCRRRA
jgi:hypothetical protein